MENIVDTLDCAIDLIGIAQIYVQQFDGKTAYTGRSSDVANNAPDMDVRLLN